MDRNNLNVGIKYCGDCVSKYNRGEVSRKIMKKFPKIKFTNVVDGGAYDYIIVLSGCESRCADIKQYNFKKQIIHIDNTNYQCWYSLVKNSLC